MARGAGGGCYLRAPAEGTLRSVAVFVATLGIGVATYITIADSGGGAPTCLGGGERCETVAESSYSHIAGVNIAVFGIVGYLLLLARRCFAATRPLGRLRVALGGFGFSVYLTYLELFMIDAICQWCVVSAVLMTILFLSTPRAWSATSGDAERERTGQSERAPQAPPAAPARRLPGDRGVVVLIVVNASKSNGGDASNMQGAGRGRPNAWRGSRRTACC